MEAGHGASSAPLICTHPVGGSMLFPPPCNPWVLYGIPGLLMGLGYAKKAGEAEHVPQGAPAPGPCWG